MTNDGGEFTELIAWLQAQNYSEAQIAKIIEQVKQYEDGLSLVSEMDSIERNDFQIAAIIQEALAESDESEE